MRQECIGVGALRHLRFTLVHQNFPLTVVITHGRFSIWGWADDPEVNQMA